jgi:farnesyl diphosphate synthase
MRERQARIERVLSRVLPPVDIAPARLHSAMRYATLEGGKRVRPLLAYAAGELAQAPTERVDQVAAAAELIHAYSLVHDDLPCMDDDTLRRGKATVHVAFDEATALLVGDSLQSLAFQLLAERTIAERAQTQVDMIAILARAAGSRGMAGGQAIDLVFVGQSLTVPALEFMHVHKTGALIRAAILLGAHCGTALDDTQVEQLDRFGKYIGLAFQVIDDVLDADGTTAMLGKTAGKDEKDRKPTYVMALGLSRARELAWQLRDDAMQSLQPLGEAAGRLREIAEFIVARKT